MVMADVETLEKVIEDAAFEALKVASTKLSPDAKKALESIMETSIGEIGKVQLQNILEDIEIARKDSLPICQDTGLISFKVVVGEDFPIKAKLREILKRATIRATKEVPLRPNAVDIFDGNTKNNVGLRGYVPFIYWEVVEGDELLITALPKGGGSSNIARLGMLKPGVGIKGIKKFVLETIAKAGGLGCPPYTVGVGIGVSEDACMYLAKKALQRPIGDRHPDPRIAEIEDELLELANQLEIGVMGLGDGKAVLDVHVELGARHPASLPVGVVMSCWAFRECSVRIKPNGEYQIIERGQKK